jgi:carboxyl-terminal processing protease
MRRLLFFLAFILCLGAGLLLNHASRFRDVYRSICDLTEDHFYKADARLEKWVRLCRLKAARVPLRSDEAALLRDIQDHMNELQVSHFQVYDPNEDKRLWKGESVDTGIRSRYVEDLLIVYRVEKGSAGEEAGIKPGDEIISLPGTEQVTPWGAMRRTGKFGIKRRAKEMEFEVKARDLIVDSAPKLSVLKPGVALLNLSSFRSEYFPPGKWKEIAAGLSAFGHVIVDVRENAGGSFVAMLRALSTFHCGGHLIGTILQPRKALPAKDALDDDTSDLHQIEELEKYSSVGLRTYGGYGCYKGKVTVLMGPDTSSTAEIFAESFLKRPHSRVWGLPTAGDVILAVWYDLPALGRGYSVSIPEAVYLTSSKEELESRGVTPQRELQYEIEQSLLGKDSWIEDALK